MIKQICFLLVLLGGYSVSMMAADKKEVYIARTESTVTIGNEYLSREFSLADGKVRTRVIENKRTGSEAIRILPEVASEEFVIRTLTADSLASDIYSSALSLQEIQVAEEGKDGKRLIFHYKNFRHQGVDWQVDMVLELEKGKHYMRKYLEITVPDSQRHLARLDYIDFELAVAVIERDESSRRICRLDASGNGAGSGRYQWILHFFGTAGVYTGDVLRP